MELKTVSSFEEVPANHGVFARMGLDGDTKTIWDRTKPAEVEAARATFDSLRNQGYSAYKVEGRDGTKGELVHEFDPNAERYIFSPAMQGG